VHASEEVEIVRVSDGALLDDARALVWAYGEWVRGHAGFEGALEVQGFSAELDALPGDYAEPAGRFLMALVNGLPGGTIALRSLGEGIGEVKRLFVAPGYRGMSLGNRLLEAVVEEATSMGLATLRLDTLPFMSGAARLYRRMGFVECEPYGSIHLPGARYFELPLESAEPMAELVTFRPEYAGDFERLNRAWLEEFFRVEEKDEELFRDLQSTGIPGGEVFFVRVGRQVVGACAILRHEEGVYELAKMAVDREHRGRGYGEWLVRATIDFARARGGSRLYLLSDEILRDALRLYERVGFRRAPFPGATGYQRGDVMMEFPL
jgi:GNAT superfamily N-acetyltransferase